MRVNVEKVLERDQKLSELDNRAGKHIILIIIFFYIYTNIIIHILIIIKRVLTSIVKNSFSRSVVNLLNKIVNTINLSKTIRK